MKTARLHLASLVLIVMLSPIAAQGADWEDWPTADRWNIGAGYFSPHLDTTIIVTDANDNIGTGISFEKTLGLDDNKATGLLNVDWRFFKRHTLSYQKKELFVGLGISLQDLAFGIQGTESSPIPGETINSTLESTAPLPTLNIGFDYAFSDKWVFQSRLGWLAVELDFGTDEDLSGEIINATAGIQWRAFKNVGFSAYYQLFDVSVDYLDAGVRFAIDYNYNGPVLGVSVNF